MLWCAKKTEDHLVGNSGQGMYWQGSGKTHRSDKTHRMGGLGTWHHAEGVPHACTARRKLTQPENKCPLPDGAPAQG